MGLLDNMTHPLWVERRAERLAARLRVEETLLLAANTRDLCSVSDLAEQIESLHYFVILLRVTRIEPDYVRVHVGFEDGTYHEYVGRFKGRWTLDLGREFGTC